MSGLRAGLPRYPCRIRGASEEEAPERPALTVAQVFELAEVIGRHPVGNVRKLPKGGYRAPVQPQRREADRPADLCKQDGCARALWAMTVDGRAEYVLFDRLGLLRQLGMAPPPRQPPT